MSCFCFVLSVPCFVPFRVCLSFLFFNLDTDLHLFFHVDNAKAHHPCASANRPTGYKPKLPDDFHHSETTELIFQEESVDKDTVPSYLFDAEHDDETIGRALSSPLFIQEREEPANRRQAYHSFEENLLPAQSFSVCHSGTERPVHELRSLSSPSSCREKPSLEMEDETVRTLLWSTKWANSRWF